MALGVPGEGGDAVAGLDAEGEEGVGQLAGALGDLSVGAAGDGAFDGAGDDFNIAVEAFGKLNLLGDEEGLVHHLCEHGWSWGVDLLIGDTLRWEL